LTHITSNTKQQLLKDQLNTLAQLPLVQNNRYYISLPSSKHTYLCQLREGRRRILVWEIHLKDDTDSEINIMKNKQHSTYGIACKLFHESFLTGYLW